MKRKIVNGLLLMAFTVLSVSSFVACKDSDEDLYVDLVATQGKLGELIKEHQDGVWALQEDLDSVGNRLGLVCDSLAGVTAGLQEQLDSLKSQNEEEIDSLIEDIKEATDAAAAAQAAADAAQAIADAAQAAADAANSSIETILGEMATNSDVEALLDSIAALNSQLAIVQALAEQALAAAGEQKCDCEDLKARVKALEDMAGLFPGKMDSLAKETAEALALAKWDSIQIAKNKAAIDSLNNKTDEHDKKLADLEEKQKQANAAIESLNEKMEEVTKLASEALATAKAALDKANNNAVAISLLDIRVEDLEDAVAELQDQIDDLLKDVKKIKKDVKKLKDELANVKEDIQNMITSIIVQAAESPVIGYANTPVGLNATILAVYYGTPNANWDFPATSATPYLNGTKDFEKWTARNLEILGGLSGVEGYVKGNAGETLVTAEGKAGNAGTLYLTVNPASVDFAGQTLKLKDSQDGDAPAVLSPLAKSDRVLNFGYTRAADNGFYEAKATISANDVAKAKMNLDFGSVKEEAKDLLNNRSLTNVIELGGALVKSAGNVMPAYGVTASWTDHDGKDHNLYSQYNVAATAVKPLSLAFLNDWSGVQTVPGFERLQDIVAKMVDKIRIDLNLPNIGDFKDIEFKEITVDGIDFSKLKVKLTMRLDGDGQIKVVGRNDKIYTVTVEQGEVVKIVRDEDGKELAIDNWYIEEAEVKNELIDDKWFLTCYYYFGEEMKDVVSDLVDQFNGSIPNDLADLFNELKKLDDINDAITDAKNSVKEQISKYLTRFNNKLTSWINRAPNMLHLALVANEGNKIGLLSQSKLMPTQADGELKLIPTTYSLELVAPTYKKFVAVTDVFNANGTNAPIAKAKAANNGTNMAKVIEGDATCTVTGEKGYIYEVTYTAVDYFGKVAIRKYYVKF